MSPGLNRKVLDSAFAVKLPFYPGITTASELATALEYDIRLLKYFPAEPIGGLGYLNSMNTPYAHLRLQYIPLGGINPDNLAAYLKSPLIAAVGGSWIAERKLIAAGDWQTIRKRAKEAPEICKSI